MPPKAAKIEASRETGTLPRSNSSRIFFSVASSVLLSRSGLSFMPARHSVSTAHPHRQSEARVPRAATFRVRYRRSSGALFELHAAVRGRHSKARFRQFAVREPKVWTRSRRGSSKSVPFKAKTIRSVGIKSKRTSRDLGGSFTRSSNVNSKLRSVSATFGRASPRTR